MRFKKIYIEITNMCNMSCSFCSNDNRTKKEMSIKEFEYVLNEIKPYTQYVYLHIKGEPFIHSKINEILNLCKKHNFKINITTNGTLLKKYMQIIIKNNSIRQINISLHSYENESNNNNYINEIMDFSNEVLNKTNIIIVYRFWAVIDNELNEANKKIINNIKNKLTIDFDIEQLLHYKKDIKLKNNLYISKGNIFEWPNLENEYIGNNGYCYGLKTHVGILSDGTVVPCCLDSLGVINLGNIFNESFSTIINKERTKKMIYNFNNNKVIEPLCQKCSYRLQLKEMTK